MLEGLVFAVEGATAVDTHGRSRRTQTRGRIFADIFPPYVFNRAVAEAMDAVGRQIADHHVADDAAVLDIEYRRLTFRLAAARQVITVATAVKGAADHHGAGQLDGLA